MPQCLTVPPEPLASGNTIKVCYGGTPNTTVTVTIDNGGSPPITQQLSIDLGPSGEGCAEWTVPEWSGAVFSCGGDCPSLTRAIA